MKSFLPAVLFVVMSVLVPFLPAAEGAKLTQFNCPAPFCAPTRAALQRACRAFDGMRKVRGDTHSDTRDARRLVELPEKDKA